MVCSVRTKPRVCAPPQNLNGNIIRSTTLSSSLPKASGTPNSAFGGLAVFAIENDAALMVGNASVADTLLLFRFVDEELDFFSLEDGLGTY